jgi:hypothetical protein
MKNLKRFSLLLSLLLTLSFTSSTTVFVCDSETSIAYHASRSCKGLNRCTHTIISVSENDAINRYGKRACKICY